MQGNGAVVDARSSVRRSCAARLPRRCRSRRHGDRRDQHEMAIAQSHVRRAEGQFSPDGKWVALVSNESGRAEVFVQTFPDGQIAHAGLHGRRHAGALVCRRQGDLLSGPRWQDDGRQRRAERRSARCEAAGGAVRDVSRDRHQRHRQQAAIRGRRATGGFFSTPPSKAPASPIVVSINWMKRLQ